VQKACDLSSNLSGGMKHSSDASFLEVKNFEEHIISLGQVKVIFRGK